MPDAKCSMSDAKCSIPANFSLTYALLTDFLT
jgi:hypothetical protein